MNFADFVGFVGFGFAGFANFALAKCRQVKRLELNFGFASFENSGFGLNLDLNSGLNSNFGLNSACLVLNLDLNSGFLSYQLAKRLDFARRLLAKCLALNFALNLDFG